MVAQEARRQYEAEFDAEAQLLLGDVLAPRGSLGCTSSRACCGCTAASGEVRAAC